MVLHYLRDAVLHHGRPLLHLFLFVTWFFLFDVGPFKAALFLEGVIGVCVGPFFEFVLWLSGSTYFRDFVYQVFEHALTVTIKCKRASGLFETERTCFILGVGRRFAWFAERQVCRVDSFVVNNNVPCLSFKGPRLAQVGYGYAAWSGYAAWWYAVWVELIVSKGEKATEDESTFASFLSIVIVVSAAAAGR